MSSLEMLSLLELAQGRPLIHGQEPDRAFSRWEALRPAIGRLVAFGKRSLLVLALLALWEAVPRLGLADPAFLPPFSDVIAGLLRPFAAPLLTGLANPHAASSRRSRTFT